MSDWFEGGGAGKSVDVAALMDSGVPEVLWRIVQAGALLSIGTTSDGGSLGITVTLDGRWRRDYFRDAEEATSWLLGAATAIETSEAPPASSGRRSRQRAPRGR